MRLPRFLEPDRPETIVAEGAVFRGHITARGSIHIQGRVEGNVRCEDRIVVGEHGQVDGDVWARVVTIGGKVQGRVEATERAELLSTGSLAGDIHAPAVAIEIGAAFEGATHMGVAG